MRIWILSINLFEFGVDLSNAEKMVISDNSAISVETLPPASQIDDTSMQDQISASTGSLAAPIAGAVRY